MNARAHVIISGIVQGVFFRTTVRARAKMLSLKGWVRNTEEGSVEAVFEGEKENIEEILKFCRTGPSSAAVESAIVGWEKPLLRFDGFEIKSDFSEVKKEEEPEAEQIEVQETGKEQEAAEILVEGEAVEESGDKKQIKPKKKKTFVVGGEELEEEEPEW